MLGESNFVLSISEGTHKGKPAVFYDLLRFEGGKIVECGRRRRFDQGAAFSLTKGDGRTSTKTLGFSASRLVSAFRHIWSIWRRRQHFLVQNWKQTELGKDFDIFEEDGELVGQQYQSDTGPMDILAIKKDKTQLLVVELKKGRARDAVVGQVLRYMGYVKQELAESNQSVKGVIIALDDDTRIRRALAMTPDISFYRYEVSFKLTKAS